MDHKMSGSVRLHDAKSVSTGPVDQNILLDMARQGQPVKLDIYCFTY